MDPVDSEIVKEVRKENACQNQMFNFALLLLNASPLFLCLSDRQEIW